MPRQGPAFVLYFLPLFLCLWLNTELCMDCFPVLVVILLKFTAVLELWFENESSWQACCYQSRTWGLVGVSLGHVKEPFINHPEGRRSLDGGNLALRCSWPWWFWHTELCFLQHSLCSSFPTTSPSSCTPLVAKLRSTFWALICGSASLTIVVLWTLFGKIQSPLNLL